MLLSGENTPSTPLSADTLTALATPRRADVERWIDRGHPDDGPFMVWLSGRFTPSEVPNLISRLKRCATAADVERLVQLRLADKLTHRRG